VIQLDSKLIISARDFSNTSEQYPYQSVFHREVDLSGNRIRLYIVFEAIWSEAMDTVQNRSIDSILFIIGENAGFTDSRIVYIWLRSHIMIHPQSKLGVIKSSEAINPDSLTEGELAELMAQSSSILEYSQEPRIG